MTRFRALDRSHSLARMVAAVAPAALALLLAGGGALAASHAPATDASSAADAPKPSVPMPSAPMPGTGEAVERGDLRIEDAWTRQPPPGARAGGGYLRITNRGTRPDRLVEGTAPFADAIEIHSMSVVDGIMRMAEIEGGLVIAPGETAELVPGGNHVMMIGLAPDESVELVKSLACRPSVEGPRYTCLPSGSLMPLTESTCAISIQSEHLGQGSHTVGNLPSVAGKTR